MDKPMTNIPPKPLQFEEVMRIARERLAPRCRCCKRCDGIACAGEVPGFGGIGTGGSFRANVDALERLRFRMLSIHDAAKPDTSLSLWGERLSMPILSAPLGGTTYNMGGGMSEEEFTDALIGGCASAGTIGAVADGIGDPLAVFEMRLRIASSGGRRFITFIKPRTQEEIMQRVRLAEAAGALAVGIDIDSAGRAARALPGQIVEPKTVKQLRELVASTSLPFIVKGIMSVRDALAAGEAGAQAIVVSNHGGRVLDHVPGAAEVLPEIAAAVANGLLVMCDGGVRYGADVLKLLALGAKAVLVGRPMIRGAFGGGSEGVALLLNKMKNELGEAMVLTGTRSIGQVDPGVLIPSLHKFVSA
jgi:4-hydroxymandelate oxidase